MMAGVDPTERERRRLVFGAVAEEYDRHRPHYPADLFDQLEVLAGERREVLDVGTGTGRVAVPLAERGLSGHAVEPDAQMAAVARSHLPDSWTIETSGFEDCTASGRSDWPLITSGQAWHWVDPARGFARAARALAPGGRLVTFWNRADWPQGDLRRAVDEIYARLAPEVGATYAKGGVAVGGLARAGEPTDLAPGFVSREHHELRFTQAHTAASWTAFLATSSDHLLLDDDRRRAVLDAIAGAIDAHGGRFDLAYRVDISVYVADRDR